jgi:hypothetical protein
VIIQTYTNEYFHLMKPVKERMQVERRCSRTPMFTSIDELRAARQAAVPQTLRPYPWGRQISAPSIEKLRRNGVYHRGAKCRTRHT